MIECHVADALDQGQWQHFARATAAAAVASTLSFPVIADGKVVGSVNLYAASAKGFAGLHENIARISDAWAPGAITNTDRSFSSHELARQAPHLLQEEFDIHVAVGILSGRGLELEEARERLSEAARRARDPFGAATGANGRRPSGASSSVRPRSVSGLVTGSGAAAS